MENQNNRSESVVLVLSEQEENTISECKTKKNNIQLLDGHEVLDILGEGGMGKVFRVRELSLNRIVAMKIMSPDLQHNKVSIHRFLREAQICAQLQHPNIIPIYRIGVLPGGRHYFTMREIKGLELTDKIKKFWDERINIGGLRQLLHAFAQVCDTIAFAHDQGVIHRDIKPSNIMIGRYGEIQIVDWGLAKKSSINTNDTDMTLDIEMTKHGCIIGTPAFMSPEQSMGDTYKIGKATDIYSLGCVLYNILTGEVPFYDIEEESKFNYIRSERPTPIKTVLKNKNKMHEFIIDSLIQIANKAMQKEIHKRYQSSKEISEAILFWLVNSQNREKAYLLFHEGNQFQIQIEDRNEDLLEVNKNLQRSYSMNGFSKKTILLWKEKTKIEHTIQSLYEQMIRKYNEALLIDQNIQEIHEKIIREIFLWNRAIIYSNMGSKNSKILKILRRHISFLDEEAQKPWLELICSESIDYYRFKFSNSTKCVGRKKERKALLKLLESKHSYCIINGFAGVGKSHFVLDTLLEEKLRNKNIKLKIIDCTDIASICELQHMFFQKHCSEESKTESSSTTQPIYIVLDNVFLSLSKVVREVEKWSSKHKNLFFLITTRNSESTLIKQTLTLHSLKITEAVTLFEKMAQNIVSQFHLDDSNLSHVLSIVNILNRLPLAMHIAVSRLSSLSILELEEHLQNPLSLIRKSPRNDGQSTLLYAMNNYWSSLSPNARYILSQCSIFKGGFTLCAAKEIIVQNEMLSSTMLIDLIDELVSDNLLYKRNAKDGSYRFYMHEFFAQYAKEKIIHDLDQYEALQNRHCAYFARMGREHILFDEPDKNVQKMIFELPNLKVAGLKNSSEGFDCSLSALKVQIYHAQVSTALKYAQIIKKKKLSHVQLLTVEFYEAICNITIGNLLLARKQLDSCISNIKKSKYNEPYLLAQCYLKLVEIDIKESNHEHSFELLKNTEEIFKKIGSIFGLYKTNRLISKLYFNEGKYEKSCLYEQKALSLLNDTSKVSTRYSEFIVMASIHLAQGNYKRAITMYKHAMNEAEKSGQKLHKSKILGNISTMYVNFGDFDKAMQYYKKALAIQQDFGDLHALALTIGMAGRIYFHQNLYLKSIENFKHCIKISEENNFHRIHAIFRGNLGITYRKMNLLEKAKEEISFAINKTASLHPTACGAFQAEMALILIEEGKIAKAKDHIHSSILLSKNLKSEYVKVLCKSVLVYLRSKDIILAQKNLCEAQQLIESFSLLPESEVNVLYRNAKAEVELYEEQLI